MERKNLSDDEIKQKACESIDVITKQIKSESRNFFDVLVERSVEVISDKFDIYINKLKGKVKNGHKQS